jgi:xylose isomerase
MSTFGPDPEHRFAFGLRTIGPVEPWEFVYRLGDVGAWGVGLHDDDLVPVGASPSERDDIFDKVAKALDSTGMVVSIAAVNFSGHAVFGHGAFTAADRDVRRYAIQKAMRAIDVGTEIGAVLHELPAAGERGESIAAKPPLVVLDRFREAVDFLCAYACEQGYPVRFVLRPSDGHGESFLSTVGHALAFIGNLDRPDMVGVGPNLARGSVAVAGVAQAIDARKLFHARLDNDPDAFALAKLLEESSYDGPLHFDVDPGCLDDGAEFWDITAGCMRTYRALAAKARRFADDPEIRDALAASGALELVEPSVGAFSAEARDALLTERFDATELSQRRYCDQRLDQLVTDLALGLR